MNYYPFHIGDYLSATRHLTWEEDAAFRRLLDVYYTTEKPLPTELRAVCRLVLASTDSQCEAVQIVLTEFFELTEAGWINRRAESEIDAMRDKQQKQRDKANKRWHKPDSEPGNALAMPRHVEGDAAASESHADAMPPTPTPKEKTKKEDSASLAPFGVSDPVWDDFLKIRRAKKSPMTNTALAGIQREADKAGVSLEQALKTCCERGWASFKADWERLPKTASGFAEPAWRTEQRQRTQLAAPGVSAQPATEFFIEMEPRNVPTALLG